MKLNLGEREIDVHPIADVPILAAIHSLAFASRGEAFPFKPLSGEPLDLRFNEVDDLLRQAVAKLAA